MGSVVHIKQPSRLCDLSYRYHLHHLHKRRTISLDGMEPEGAVQPSTFKREVEGESVQQDEVSLNVNGNREGRFLLYWITTTSISTSTSFTITYSVSSALCTPAGGNACA